MAHYALINSDNIVVQVITGVDENIIQTNTDGTQVGGSSEAWEQFYASLPWFEGLTCKRTSYNGNIRKNFANPGFFYDKEKDVFIPTSPFPSWILNEETCKWEPPIPKPTVPEGYHCTWLEEEGDWYVHILE